MTDQDAIILALVLKASYDDGGFTVVSPETRIEHLEYYSPEQILECKKKVGENLQTEGVDMAKLVDQLFTRNKNPVHLSLKSSPKDGYVIDYDGKYAKYFTEEGGGWEQWYKDNPTVHGSTTVSLPIYDEKSGYVLVYKGTQTGGLAGSGYLILYKYEKGELKELKSAMVWVS